jgi:hypothetical protein
VGRYFARGSVCNSWPGPQVHASTQVLFALASQASNHHSAVASFDRPLSIRHCIHMVRTQTSQASSSGPIDSTWLGAMSQNRQPSQQPSVWHRRCQRRCHPPPRCRPNFHFVAGGAEAIMNLFCQSDRPGAPSCNFYSVARGGFRLVALQSMFTGCRLTGSLMIIFILYSVLLCLDIIFIDTSSPRLPYSPGMPSKLDDVFY